MSGTLPGMINGGTLLTSPTTLGAEERLLAVGADGQAAAKTAAAVRTMIDFTAQASAAAPVQSVAGRTGTVTLTKSDVGLGNVDNTSDTSKPISTATQTALDAKADLVGGLVPSAQIPAIAITEYLGSVASQSAMLALAGQKGDWAIRTDLGTTWVITGNDPTSLASWTALSYPTAPVTSVNGQTGAVTLAAADVGAAAASHNQAWSTITGTPTTRAGYGITDAQPLDAELSAIAGLTSAADKLPYFTGSGTAALADLSSFARTLLDDADAAAARTTLGITSASPGGSSGQVQFNNGGAFGGAAGLAWSTGSPNLTVTAQGASHIPALLRAAASQTAELLCVQNSSSQTFGKLMVSGAMEFGRSGPTGGNDCMAIGPSDSTFRNTGNTSYHTARGISSPASWGIYAQSTQALMFSSTSIDPYLPISFQSSGVITCGGVDSPLTLRGYNPSTQARTGNGVDIEGGPGGTGSPGNYKGGDINIRAGRTAGNATPAVINFQTAPAGSSGGGLQAWVDAFRIDANATAGQTRLLLWDIDAGAMKRVSIGASDSGGTGFKLLRVAN